jgi:hypothetical protein
MRRLIVLALVLAVGFTVSTGCGREDLAGPAASSSPTTSTPATPSGTPGRTSAGTPTITSTWSSDPLTVDHTIQVPPVPTLIGIRSAAHPEAGFDRITFDIRGPVSGYQVRYVNQVVEDPSGRPADVPGRQHLQITFRQLQAHDDSGFVLSPRAGTFTYPRLRAYAVVGDFEGVVTVALGLDDVVGYRVGELPGQPNRVYLDVAAPKD